ncbi:putative ribonuclease H-like domain-containing protein [Tanacetum coccineum]
MVWTLSTYLQTMFFHRGQIDKTLFIKRHKDDILLVQVYVDDIIFGSTKNEMSNEFETLMHDKFQMSSIGELSFFLGLQQALRMETNKALIKDEEAEDVDVHLYRSMIRSLMYLTASRPEIMFAVCACARFQVTPKTLQFNVVKRIFRYLKGQPKLGLWYPRDSPFDLEAFSDSDYAGASLDRKSTTGGKSKEVRTPRYLSLVVPLKKVGDEAVHKELGDRMERTATTASSLEAEQDSGSSPRCQDTILGDVDAQTSIQFLLLVYINAAKLMLMMLASVNAVRHILILSVQVPTAKDNLIIYTSCNKQFWATATVKIVNGVRQLQALVDKKRVIVMESSIRRDLHLDDAEGTDCLPTATIYEELSRMGYEKPSQKLTFYKAFFYLQWKYFIHTITQYLSAKSTAWNEFSSIMASLIICLATTQKFNLSKYIFDAMVKHLDGGKKQPSKKTQRQEAKVSQDEIEHEESVPTPFNDPQPSGEDSMQLTNLMVLCIKLQTQVLDLEKSKDAQAKEIAALKKRIQKLERKKMSRPAGESIADDDLMMGNLVDETQERQDYELMFDTGVLDTDEMKQNLKIVLAPTTIEEITLLQTLIQIKASEANVCILQSATTTTTASPKARGVVVQELSEFRVPQETQPSISKDKGKAKLDAELIEEQKLARKQEEEANIALIESWENIQADEWRLIDCWLERLNQKKERKKKVEGSEEIAKGSRKKKLGRKRARKEQQQESSKKQKVEEEKELDEVEEVDEDDEAELKKLLVIKKDKDIAIDVIPLATKLPVIIDYKLLKEGVMIHYQLIKAYGSSKRYSSMIRMLQGIDRRLGKLIGEYDASMEIQGLKKN